MLGAPALHIVAHTAGLITLLEEQAPDLKPHTPRGAALAHHRVEAVAGEALRIRVAQRHFAVVESTHFQAEATLYAPLLVYDHRLIETRGVRLQIYNMDRAHGRADTAAVAIFEFTYVFFHQIFKDCQISLRALRRKSIDMARWRVSSRSTDS